MPYQVNETKDYQFGRETSNLLLCPKDLRIRRLSLTLLSLREQKGDTTGRRKPNERVTSAQKMHVKEKNVYVFCTHIFVPPAFVWYMRTNYFLAYQVEL